MLKSTLASALAILALSACSSSASLARRDTMGGRVQIAGAYMPAMADARMLMVDACRGRFDYVEVGSAVEFRCKRHAEQHAAEGSQVARAETQKGL
jgi:hypothetical protein